MPKKPDPTSPDLSARHYAAIQLRVPESGEPWLDAMIRVARLLDYQQAAMAAIVGREAGNTYHPADVAKEAELFSIALLQEQAI